MHLILLPVIAYLLGAVPWGAVVVRVCTGKDIRRQGSGNIGATNVRRIAGGRAAAATLLLDMLKGALPVMLAVWFVRDGAGAPLYISLTAMAAFVGHCYPVYTRFKGGGKGVATALGSFLVIAPFAALIAVLVFVMMLCFFGRVSLGSMTGAAVLPVAVWQATHSTIFALLGTVFLLLILLRHRDNLVRLAKGEEPSVFRKG